MRWIQVTFFLVLVSGLVGCSGSRKITNNPVQNLANSPDYAQLVYWAAHPAKQDPSDSIPVPLKASYRYDTSVHVFFIHPTTFTDKKDSSDNASLVDVVLNQKTDESPILYQASIFNQYPVYAPRYRQAHIRNYYITDTARALAAFDQAYADIRAAFLYYWTHENKGRPIVVASHSQGTTHAIRLMQEFFDGKPARQQLVAAYLIGMYLPADRFEQISLCTDSASTGCVLAWRTYQMDYLPPFVQKEKDSSLVVNPLSWKSDFTYVPNRESKGAVLRNFNKVIPQAVDAQVQGKVLWMHKPDVPGKILLRMKNYHIGDLNLFYVDIRSNVDTRVRTYRSLHP